jgi:hypothetical protein
MGTLIVHIYFIKLQEACLNPWRVILNVISKPYCFSVLIPVQIFLLHRSQSEAIIN